ncbi:glycosyltransferase family 4 protein [Patulibacter americanus]|uniref:glycosyltransferase family 4 protein n=1 Tax=Patulibacter americanus TaxID=588672 RepID=UPI0003B4F889|nr:glycosyltransferase family 4 protein [Patulibacter americanus]
MSLPPASAPRRLRVLTVIDHLSGGGAERAAVEIATRLAARHDVTVVGSREAQDGPAATALRDAGLRVLALDRTATRRAWEWAPVVRELRRARVDVLHTHLFGSNAWGPALRRLGGARALVAHEHTPFLRRGGVRAWGAQGAVNPWIVGPFADRVLVPSTWSLRALVDHERVPERKVRVVPNGAPEGVALPAAERAALRRALGLEPDDVAVVVSAMLRPEKGHATALRALALLRERHPRVRLLVVGGGPAQDREGTGPELRRLASELGVADAVRFAGRREDVPAVLAASDVALLPSDHENLPLALLEHLAAGLPVVATAVGGIPDAVTDGVHALLVPPGEPRAMADALARTLDDPSAARVRAAAGRDRHAERYTWDAVAGAVEAQYVEALGLRA